MVSEPGALQQVQGCCWLQLRDGLNRLLDCGANPSAGAELSQQESRSLESMVSGTMAIGKQIALGLPSSTFPPCSFGNAT